MRAVAKSKKQGNGGNRQRLKECAWREQQEYICPGKNEELNGDNPEKHSFLSVPNSDSLSTQTFPTGAR